MAGGLVMFVLVTFGAISRTLSAPTPSLSMPHLELSHICEEAFINMAMTASPCIPLPMISMMNPSLARDLNPDSYRSVLLGYCNGPFCSKPEAKSVFSYVESQCKEDLQKPVLVTALFLLENYEAFKEMSCVEDSFGGNCLLEYHDTYNSNPLDFAYDELCTECNQSLFNTYQKWSTDYPSFFNVTYFKQLEDICQFTSTQFSKILGIHN